MAGGRSCFQEQLRDDRKVQPQAVSTPADTSSSLLVKRCIDITRRRCDFFVEIWRPGCTKKQFQTIRHAAIGGTTARDPQLGSPHALFSLGFRFFVNCFEA